MAARQNEAETLQEAGITSAQNKAEEPIKLMRGLLPKEDGKLDAEDGITLQTSKMDLYDDMCDINDSISNDYNQGRKLSYGNRNHA